jgi:hypothetical protein
MPAPFIMVCTTMRLDSSVKASVCASIWAGCSAAKPNRVVSNRLEFEEGAGAHAVNRNGNMRRAGIRIEKNLMSLFQNTA